jgi:hypothetical protein
MRIGLHVLCFVALASVASAQSSNQPFPDAVMVNGGWVPCSHQIAIDAGKGCGSTTPTPTPPPDCDNVNAYVDPANATRCALNRNDVIHPAVPVYQVGREYEYVYPNTSYRMVVIGLSRSLDGVEVVTFQWTRDAGTGHKIGDVKACRNDNGASAESSCTLWVAVK